MRKILATLAVLFALSATCFAATPTDVCDFDAKTFCRNYNHLINFMGMTQRAAIDEGQILERSNQNGDFVIMPLKNFGDGSGTVIGLVIDQQGYIWEVNLHNENPKTEDEMATAIAIALFTIGLEKDDCDALLDELNRSGTADMYFPSIGRYLAVDASTLSSNGVGRFEISAHAD